jgi:hypothetical protein
MEPTRRKSFGNSAAGRADEKQGGETTNLHGGCHFWVSSVRGQCDTQLEIMTPD